eukprot:scaffold859_cov234-Ochromonas_danica.AAC.9
MEAYHEGNIYFMDEKYQQALEDFNSAIRLEPNYEIAHYRRGVALFELEEYESAKQSFQTALSLRNQENAVVTGLDSAIYARYIRKCDVEIVADGPEQPVAPAVAKEVPSAPTCSASSAIPPTSNTTTASVSKSVKVTLVPSLTLPIKYQYYQSTAKMNISVLVKGLSQDNVVVDMTASHLRVTIVYTAIITDSNGERQEKREEIVIDKDLFGDIDPVRSSVSVLKSKIEIVLQKIEEAMWPSLEAVAGDRKAVVPPPAVATTTPPPPAVAAVVGERPKPYASPRDWDKLGSEIVKEVESEKPEGEEALQKLFQQIYRNADPETRMAMNKSFQTSGGTVLSTNWSEVSKTDYETKRQAPKGLEWRNWEGEKLPQADD